MQATVITCRDPFRPQTHRTISPIRKRRRVRALAPKTNQPFIAILNGRPIKRAEWSRRMQDGDVLSFVVLPQGGGGGSDPLRVILTLAVIYYAPYLAESALGTTFGAYTATAMGGTTVFLETARAVIAIGGMVLVNTLVPPPKLGASGFGSTPAPSPTYSLSAQGNQARIDQPIPVLYGRNMIYPDFAAQPYIEFSGNEQFLFQLHLIGQGEYDIEAIRIEDTPITNFDEIEYEIVQPWNEVTLFPTQVISSIEVSGQEMTWNTDVDPDAGDIIGPFVANAADTLANVIGIDIVLPRGIYIAEGVGLSKKTVTWRIEYRPIDADGNPTGTGAWTERDESYSGATTTPQRISNRYSVAPGRYEVRARRMNAKSTATTESNEIVWGSLRAYLVGSNMYGNVTMLALRMQASNNLSQQASRKINVICTRKLPTWNGMEWSSPVATSNPAWALADIARADYGGGLVDSRIDLDGLQALAATWASRGDECNIIFDSQATIWEALTTVARTGRAFPFLQGGILRFFRDEPQTMPVGMFTPRNIARNSLQLSYVMPSEESSDSVDVEYFDGIVWKWKTVRAALLDSSATKPVKVKLPGVTSRSQAWREGMYMAACNRYRRRFVSFGTEMEGFIPALGDLLTVTHDMPTWGQSSEVAGFNDATRELILSDAVTFSVGTHYIAWRGRNGAPVGPFIASAGTSANVVVLQDWNPLSDPYPDYGAGRERSHVAFGPADSQWIKARVMSVRPQGMERCNIELVVESDYVHEADTGASPGSSAWALPLAETAPTVRGLIAKSMPGSVGQMIVSWAPAPGANNYLVEISADEVSWTRVGDTTANNYTGEAIYGSSTFVRVAAVGVVRGAWVVVNYGSSAGYMWNSDESTLMWSGDSNPMWTY